MGFLEEFDDVKENEPTGELVEPSKGPRPAPKPTPPPVVLGSAEEIVANMLGQGQAEPQTVAEAVQVSEDAYMGEVDKRLEVASYYREVLNGDLFANGSEAARIVMYEIRAFVRSRLGVLLSIQDNGQPVPGQLSDEEVQSVKLWAGLSQEQFTALKLLAEKLVAATGGNSPPQLRTVAPPAAPAPKSAPALVQRQAPVAATINSPPQPPEPVKRGPGRPPGAKNKVKLVEEVVAIDKETGQPLLDAEGNERKVRVQRIQRPAGALPFPSSNAQMAAATQIKATEAAAIISGNPRMGQALTAIANTPTDE